MNRILKKFISNFIIVSAVFSLLHLEVLAASNKKSSKDFNGDAPTKIRSKKIDIKRDKQEIRFIDDVIVENGESSMLSKEMLVIYEEKKGAEKTTDIKRIDAIGNVKIFNEEFIATSNSGYYIPSKEQFVLEDNVIVNNGTYISSGSKFIYNLLTKESRFVGVKNESSITGKGGNISDDRVIVIIGESDAKSNTKEND